MSMYVGSHAGGVGIPTQAIWMHEEYNGDEFVFINYIHSLVRKSNLTKTLVWT